MIGAGSQENHAHPFPRFPRWVPGWLAVARQDRRERNRLCTAKALKSSLPNAQKESRKQYALRYYLSQNAEHCLARCRDLRAEILSAEKLPSYDRFIVRVRRGLAHGQAGLSDSRGSFDPHRVVEETSNASLRGGQTAAYSNVGVERLASAEAGLIANGPDSSLDSE